VKPRSGSACCGSCAPLERLQAMDLVESTEDGWILDRAVLAAATALRA
jgi:hypothetical protein